MPDIWFRKYRVGEPVIDTGEVFYPVIRVMGRKWVPSKKWWVLDLPPFPTLNSTTVIDYHKSKEEATAHSEQLQKEMGYER